MKDPYVYESTNVLKNKLDIKDETIIYYGIDTNRYCFCFFHINSHKL